MKSTKYTKKHLLLILPVLFVIIYIGTITYGVNRPLPNENISYKSELKPVIDPVFLTDLSYAKNDNRVLEQDIFDYINEMINNADEFVLFDMFLFNNIYGEDENFPALADEMSNALLKKKQDDPNVAITVITDPVNTMYGANQPDHLERLSQADIPVIISDLDSLRDSNPLYSGFYKLFLQWDSLKLIDGLPNALGTNGKDANLHSYLTSLTGKANHRKVVLTDHEALISSGNPHDASAYHNNVAIAFKGSLLEDLLITEEAVTQYSANQSIKTNEYMPETVGEQSEVLGQILTERPIHERALSIINEAQEGDTIWIALLYLSESNICDALIDAANRNVSVQLILDQNIESFGNKKIGLPNKPVAYRLMNEGNDNVQIRWYETEKEQYHPKILFLDSDHTSEILSGSANFTRRNLEDLNLETNIYLTASSDTEIMNDVRDYFERIWTNEDGIYTADYETYKDESLWLRGIFFIQKLTKLSTF
ncbi:phospholipase D-like domain-containing protein [Alkalicoccobacillus plakortidis]|uniref:Phospholipase D-like domain-containing protein n=1 Tax=Alkalicoccobacillus plakortidis TaxID=444060 RepID=A0ABT0XHK8_9BACI|nr:phospholipase D-like domain-containing protein [Alkalicoccobacillus plakortidis]MCM2675377.1 phospholipase D-like domain-containing protein [Alkalicoccobacillus plakortidis]